MPAHQHRNGARAWESIHESACVSVCVRIKNIITLQEACGVTEKSLESFDQLLVVSCKN